MRLLWLYGAFVSCDVSVERGSPFESSLILQYLAQKVDLAAEQVYRCHNKINFRAGITTK